MNSRFALGVVAVALAGLVLGSGAWPMKLMNRYRFEHWWCVAMFTGLIAIPWAVTLLCSPKLGTALTSIPLKPLLVANLLGAGWGVANILVGICYVRIGMALTTAILTGFGVCLGVILPMVVKGSGLFQKAPDLASPAGLVVLSGVGVMVLGLILTGAAGYDRDRVRARKGSSPDALWKTFALAVLAGILSSGMSLSFVYGQGAVVEAMKREGAGGLSVMFGVWAIGLLGGSLLNILYPAWLVTCTKSWGVFLQRPGELLLAVVIGINLSIGIVLLGKGMLWLGAFGGSVGWGIQQACWLLGGQCVGFVSGEWRGVHGTPRKRMYLAIILFIIATGIITYANTLAMPGVSH